MPTALSNKVLLERCREFIYADPSKQDLEDLIKYALITSEQQIRGVDMVPLAWLRGTYNELFTKPYATISAVTQANPGVITAVSSDSDVTGHGFTNGDIVLVAGVADTERLNNRRLRAVCTEKVTDGSMVDCASNWTSGAGWTSNVASTSSADFEQDVSAVASTRYKVVFTLESVTAGSVTPQIGGVDGDAVTVNGKHTQYITTTGTGNLKFQGTAFSGTVSFASVITANTLSLEQLDGNVSVDTSSYEEYDSGGTIYHAGIKIDPTAVEPSSGSYQWKMGRIFDATIDMMPCTPIGHTRSESKWMQPVSRPIRFEHLKTFYDDPTSLEHFVLFYPPAGQRYNVAIYYEKDYPSLTTWTTAVYPPHPAEIHDFIWHRALHILATNAQKAKRLTREGGDNTKIEILQAQHWANITAQDERKIISLSREMMGDVGSANSGVAA